MLGVRVAEGLSGVGSGTAGAGAAGGGEVTSYTSGGGSGNQLTVKRGNVLRNKDEDRYRTNGAGQNGGEWDDTDVGGGGVTGKIADWLVSDQPVLLCLSPLGSELRVSMGHVRKFRISFSGWVKELASFGI